MALYSVLLEMISWLLVGETVSIGPSLCSVMECERSGNGMLVQTLFELLPLLQLAPLEPLKYGISTDTISKFKTSEGAMSCIVLRSG